MTSPYGVLGLQAGISVVSLSLGDLISAKDTLEIHTEQQHCVYFHRLFLCII